MIVPAMSVTEIYNEFVRDYEYCINRVDKDSNLYRRAIIKSSKFPMYFKPIDFVAPSRNQYVILVNAKSKRDATDPFITVFGYYLRPEGIYAALIFPIESGEKRIILFPPHFFERYKMRFIKENLCTIDVMKNFFKYNSGAIVNITDDKKFRGSCNHGFIFGEVLSTNIFLVKTYISVDMLKDEQVDLNRNLVTYLNDLNMMNEQRNFSLNPMARMIAQNGRIII